MYSVIARLAVPAVLLAIAPGAAAAGVPSTPPMVLPGSSAARAAATHADGGLVAGWLVGARPGARTTAIAAHYGARSVSDLGTYLVPTAKAKAFAHALRHAGLLSFAEPNVRQQPTAFEAAPGGWSRGAIATPTLAVPPVGKYAAGLVDQRVDTTRPDVKNTTILSGSEATVVGSHGTETASVIGAAADGEGILGTYPGVHINAFGLPLEFGCAQATAGISAVRKSGVAALNMSFGSPSFCFAEYRELQYALANGVVTVAASGNEFQDGNPLTYPAVLPHVLSVAAVGQDLKVSYFSNANAAVDLAAPGQDVPVDVPLAFDMDGTTDGFTLDDGTSFAAPAVTGAATFVKAARPELSAGQVADVLRRSAVDIDAKGYDANTGYGLVNLDRAITTPAPMRDPLEPNDGIEWVDGTAFNKPDSPIYTGKKTTSLKASVDQVEDPLDVYRIRVPGRSRVKITLTPAFGDPDLEIFSFGAKSTDDTEYLIGASRKNGTATDRSTLKNKGKSTRTAYVVVEIDPRVANLNAGYALKLQRLKFK